MNASEHAKAWRYAQRDLDLAESILTANADKKLIAALSVLAGSVARGYEIAAEKEEI